MTQRRMYQVDALSGKVEDGFVAYIAPKYKNGFSDRWVAMSQNAMLALANADLGYEASRVLWVLLANLQFENYILIPQSDLAKQVSMERGNFNRALNLLIKEGVILKGPKLGRTFSLKLNLSYGWKGKARNHLKAIDNELEFRMTASRITGIVEGGQST